MKTSGQRTQMPTPFTSRKRSIATTIAALALIASPLAQAEKAEGWLSWRGPLQTGVSLEKDLPTDLSLDGDSHLWSFLALKGGGTPVISNGRSYSFGYFDENDIIEEAVVCLDVDTGKLIWEYRVPDFLSDNVYNRYGIGSPAIDPDNGNIYFLATPGLAIALDKDGNKLWEHSMLEELGRLTFPNGRTGGPVVDGDFVIYRGITANWGRTGPAQDRYYAFEKESGKLAWYSAPGIRPTDSSFSTQVFGQLGDQRVFYVGTGSGSIVCVNARTGEPVWRTTISQGGVNASMLLHGDDKLIAIHGKENIDSTSKGRLICLKIPTEYPTGKLPIVLGADAEVWRNDDHVSFTSSPTLHDGKVYSTIATGSLLCVNADTGETIWEEKIAPDQLHASPLYADGKIYAPFMDGKVAVIDVSGDHGKVISETDMGALCLASPTIYAGKVFIQTKTGLHVFGKKGGKYVGPAPMTEKVSDKKITQLQIVPAEFALRPGTSQDFEIWGLNKSGQRIEKVGTADWETFIPPTARVKAKVDAKFTSGSNTLAAAADAKLSAGAFKATWNGLSATVRGRVVGGETYKEDFEGFTLNRTNKAGQAVAFPPLPWLGARIKWAVLEKDGSKVIMNVLERLLFQRTMNFFGHADMTNYTVQADVMTDGNRRIKSAIGLVNQRYLVTLVGNSNILEVTSNHDRLKISVPYRVSANTWYTLKTEVINNGDGSGKVVAKVWVRGEAEPDAWTIDVPVAKLHQKGAPAIFAFSPQGQKHVYIDNLEVYSNN